MLLISNRKDVLQGHIPMLLFNELKQLKLNINCLYHRVVASADTYIHT